MRRSVWLAAIVLAVFMSVPAYAQLNGSNCLGDTGVGNGTLPAPGWYVSGFYYRYSSDTIKKADGSRLVIDPGQPAQITFSAFAPMLVFASRAKVFGADYGFVFAPPLANGSLEAPAFGYQLKAEWGLGDLYVQPVKLGWHTPHADVTAAFGFYAPTGRYKDGAPDNISKGMWSYEVAAGTTVFLDSKKSVSVATTAFWETHSKKKGTEINIGDRITLTGVRVGQILTLEGGLAKSFLKGAMSVGVAYYAQWKLTQDDFGSPVDLPNGPEVGKHRVYGVGPDVMLPIATKKRLISLVNIRYFWETGARLKTQGQTLVVMATFPVPSTKLQ